MGSSRVAHTPAYRHLSYVHRSDYLRCYLMHHHGGGYSDIKPHCDDWAPFFDSLNSDPQAWMLGYPETSSADVARPESSLGLHAQKRYAELLGNGAFICKAGSPFTAAWFDEVSSRLDYYRRSLERSPAQDPFGTMGDYPVPWSMLQGQVFHPAQLAFLPHLRREPRLRPRTTDYR